MNYLKTMLLLAILTMLYMGVGFLLGGTTGMLMALAFGGITNLLAWWNSDKMVLRIHKAREVSPREEPILHQMVAQLARNADLPTPRIYVMDSEQPNAFATGRNPENSAVAMTTGIMQLLTQEELAGVIAHELAHIKNRDTLIMTLAATVAGAISVLAQFSLFFGSNRDRPLGSIGTILVAILAPLAAVVVQMTISRTREYAADRLGAQIVGNPMWLASALAKIAQTSKMMRTAARHPATAHMFISNPLSGNRMDSLFSTHPDVGNRIAELQKLAREMGTSVTQPQPGSIDRPREGRPWGQQPAQQRPRSPWG